MITPEKAWELIVERVRALPVVSRPVSDSLSAFLAEPVLADRDVPPANRSAMDGYALCAAETRSAPFVMPVSGEIPAGAPGGMPIPAGACVRIFTGANLPPGTDSVIMQEDTEPVDGRKESVRILKTVAVGENVFKQGENAKQGETLLSSGARLDAAAIALCAAVGRGSVKVHRRPVIGLLATGSELLDADDKALPHQIRDSNSPFLRAALAGQRYEVTAFERIADNPESIVSALHGLATRCDVVILTGGVSVGRYDFTTEAVRRAGADIGFHGVAIKPGKPVLFATDPGGRLIFGLPGNPLSAMVGFYEFVLPALNLLAGCDAGRCRPSISVRVTQDLTVKGSRQEYVPARLTWTATGPEALPVGVKGSSDLVAGAGADGALIVPANTQVVPAGAFLAFRPWRGLL